MASANKSSSAIVPTDSNSVTTEHCIVAGGCFWGIQHLYDKHFGDKGVVTHVGYAGGHVKNPTYDNVCNKTTGHAEAAKVEFNPAKVTYRELVDFFFHIHDPTQKDRQGNDRGSQYRSAVFCASEAQKKAAEESKKVAEEHYKPQPVVTEIITKFEFFTAEDYHQKYLEQNPNGYQCPTHRYREW